MRLHVAENLLLTPGEHYWTNVQYWAFGKPNSFPPGSPIVVQTAIRRRVFLKTLPADKAKQVILSFNRDVGLSYVFNQRDLDMHRVYGCALGISRDWADTLGVRTLNILHVAAVLELGLNEFATGDERQAQLAGQCGLKVTRL
jgi:hypothetical protein